MRTTATLLLAVELLVPPAMGADVGDRVGGIRLTDTEGRTHALSDYAGNVVVLAFWSFKCPVVHAYHERLRALRDTYAGRGVVMLAIASNANETPVEIRRNAANLRLPYPVLLDTDGVLASRVGAAYAPSVYILDRGGVIRYQGAIDNNRRPGESGRVAYAEDALQSILAGRLVEVQEMPPFGCSIRRSSK
ncbi:MAG: redoxin domain-containing protein [Acidobacteria bacterium]|nr:redoxin domain-containing protein [Acidobacteriota bacterium]